MGLLLLSVGLLLSIFEPAVANAAPGGPAKATGIPGHATAAKKATTAGCLYNVASSVTTNNSVADDATNDILTVVVTDAVTGLPVSGVTVNITTLGSATPKTDATGTVQFGLASFYTNPIPLVISVAGACNLIPQAFFNYVPAPVTTNPGPNPSYYTTIIGSAVANGSDTAVVQVHATDAINNELPGTPVRFTIVGGSGSAETSAFFNGTAVTPGIPYPVPGGLGQNGSLDLPITSPNPGTVQVEVEVWNGSSWVQIGSPQTVTFAVPPPNNNPPPGSPNPSYYTTIIPQATANNSDTAVVRLHITDGTNDEPDGYKVQFVITSITTSGPATMTGTGGVTATGGVNTTLTTVLATNANGSIDIPVMDPNVGSVSIAAYAWDPVTSAYDIPFGTQTVTFVAAPPTNNPPPGSPNPSYYITVIPQATANNSDTAVVRLHITDGTNNEPDGYKVQFVITSITTTGPATMTGTGGVTATGGVNTTLTTVLATNANGSIDIPVMDPNVGSVSIAAYAWDPVTSAYDIPFGTQTVTFVAAPPITIPPPGSPDPNPPYYITVIGTATADGTDTAVVRLHITDGTNNEPDGYKVEFVIAANTTSGNPTRTGSGGTTATGTTGTTLTTVLATNANGSIDIPITDPKAGSVSIQAFAWDPKTNLYDIPYGTLTVTFTAGKAVPGQPGGGGSGGTSPGNGGLPPGGGGSGSSGGGGGDGDNTGPGDNSNFTVLFMREPYDYQLANGVAQDSVIAYISDKNGNAVPGVSVTFFLQTSPTTGTATATAQIVGNPVTVTTDDSGMARIAITNTLPGTVFVDATIVDPASGNTVLIDGSYQIAHFVTKPDVTNIQTALTVIIGEALSDGIQQNEVKAHVVDIDGNIMPNQLVYFAIDSGTGTIVTPQPVMTDANGDAYIQITSKTTGYVLITATVDGEKIVFGSPARVYFAQINIYVPRVFTPNNDGTNDILKPILVGISTFHYFNIYNRWGNLIFTSQDPNQGWDGTFKGVPQPVETYLWIAEGIDENGKKVVQKGMTSLVR